MAGADSRVPDGFLDLDLERSLARARDILHDIAFENFIVDFSKDTAHCALNVSLAELQKSLNDRDDQQNSHVTRWINIESPERRAQSELLSCLGKKYGFSPRLLYSMQSQPMAPKPIPEPSSPVSSKRQDFMHPRKRHRPRAPSRSRAVIPEKQVTSQHDLESLADGPEDTPESKAPDLNHYSLVNDVWHFMSVDYGTDCRFTIATKSNYEADSAQIRASATTRSMD